MAFVLSSVWNVLLGRVLLVDASHLIASGCDVGRAAWKWQSALKSCRGPVVWTIASRWLLPLFTRQRLLHGVFLINPINQIMIMITATIHRMCRASEVTASVRRAIAQITINSTAIQSSECFILLNSEPRTGCAYCWVLSCLLRTEQDGEDFH